MALVITRGGGADCSRLPAQVAEEMTRMDTSLLTLLSEQRIGTFSETIAKWEGRDEQTAAHFGIGPADIHVARTCQILVAGPPLAWITETFPKDGFALPCPRPGAGAVTLGLGEPGGET